MNAEWLIDYINQHPDVLDCKLQNGIMILRTKRGDIDMTIPKEIKKVIMFDPPSGWCYGFPKPVPEGYTKTDLVYMLKNSGYKLYNKETWDWVIAHSRFWEESI